MVEKQEILTQEGYNKIEEEVEYLKTVKRKEVAERIKVAISFGDLSENAEYDEAKNEQAQVEERIVKLENMLRKAVIIDESQIEYPISLIAIGYPDEYDSLFRKSKRSYDRKKIKDICKEFNPKWNDVLEGVRVAPSIMNKQPWIFKEKEYGFDLYEKEPRRRLGIEDENKISMGAALRHFDICCKEKNISVEYIKKNVKDGRRKEYFISIIEKNK